MSSSTLILHLPLLTISLDKERRQIGWVFLSTKLWKNLKTAGISVTQSVPRGGCTRSDLCFVLCMCNVCMRACLHVCMCGACVCVWVSELNNACLLLYLKWLLATDFAYWCNNILQYIPEGCAAKFAKVWEATLD